MPTTMTTIADYVLAHTERGECKCGKCFDRGTRPDPSGHAADVFFFSVAARNSPTVDEFKALARAHSGDFTRVDPFDGREHSYIELGAWIGNQGLAMQFMGLGALLGVFRLLTPNLLPIPDDLKQQMAGMGMVSVQAVESAEAVDAVGQRDEVRPDGHAR